MAALTTAAPTAGFVWDAREKALLGCRELR